jgi:hypothetical protein
MDIPAFKSQGYQDSSCIINPLLEGTLDTRRNGVQANKPNA